MMHTLAQPFTPSTSSAPSDTRCGQAQLAATLVDLAASADRQAGRAAAFNVATSSQMFILADQLRTMVWSEDLEADRNATFAILDNARARVAHTMLQLDARERSFASPAPDRQ